MFGWLVGRFWNRRKDQVRLALELQVRAQGSDGTDVDLRSEDLSARGVRLRTNGASLSSVVGAGGDVPLEIHLEEDLPPVKVKAKMIWSYTAADGGSVSGWQFMNFHGNARRRLRNYLSRLMEEEGEWEDDAEASV